jgi:EmrB/QacA subfamily drug resistance transporter
MNLSPAEIRTVVIGAMLALFLAALDQTVIAAALPTIAQDFHDFTLISWIVTSYLLTATCVTPLVGKLSDLKGRRSVLRICLGVFIIGSVLCALAPSMILLIFARAVQGVGGGGLMIMAQTIIGDVVSPRERGRYAGYFSIVWGSSSVLGPTIGGLVTEQVGWPWIFWINVPLGLLALVISDRALRKLLVPGRRTRLEFTGVLLLCGATIALLLIFTLGGSRLSWTAPQILVLAGATLVLGAGFAWQQRYSAEAIFPSRFFRDSVTAPVLASIFVVYGCYLAVAVLAPSYFQIALGSSVSEAGLLMIPFMLSSTLTANFAGRYTHRTGSYKLPPLIGLPITAISLGVLPLFSNSLSALGVAMVLMVAGLGLGPIFPCTMVAAQNAVERQDLGAITGAIGFARALGGAVGVGAATALVLGLASSLLAQAGHITSLEDLASQQLSSMVRSRVASAFELLFVATALLLLIAFVLFFKVENRPLSHPTEPAAEVE